MNKLITYSRLLLLSSLAVLILAGCAKNLITHNSFTQIHTGMSERRVSKLLGEPTDVISVGFGPLAGTNATWEGDTSTITVQFVNGRVRGKQYSQY